MGYPTNMTSQPAAELIPCDARRILITDDETPVRDIFRMILASGFPACTIEVAANGLEALQAFQKSHHGVLLMDLKMPIMDGQTAFARIREACAVKGWEMPAVIFCTGFAPSPSIKALASAGQNHCLIQKPVTSEILLNVVRSRLPAAG